MPVRSRSTRVKRARGSGPRGMAARVSRGIRAQVHQTDVERIVFSTDIAPSTANYNPDGIFTSTVAPCGWQPLSAFNADAKYTSYIQKMWNQYKILKVSYTILFAGGDDASIMALVKPINFVYAWDRTTTWAAAALAGKTMTQVAGMSGAQYGQWQAGYPNIIHASISDVRASQDGWLSTEALPATAPNTGQYFCPGLYVTFQEYGATDTKKIKFNVKLTFEMALRGVKLDQ